MLDTSPSVANREILTHSSEETIAQGREIGATAQTASLDFAFGRSRGREDNSHEGNRRRRSAPRAKTKSPAPPSRSSTNTKAARASIMWISTALTTCTTSKR